MVVFVAFAAPLAAAAAIALFVGRGPSGSDAALASYELVVEGAGRDERSGAAPAPAETIEVERGGHLTFLLRPRAARSAEVAARAMIEHDGALRAWDVPSQVSDQGVVRIDATGAGLASLPAGASRVVVFVGNPSRLPGDDDDARRAMTGGASGVRAFVQPIVVR